MPETTSSLIRRVQDPTDAGAWAEFVQLYEPLLLRYAYGLHLQEADARDVVQEVFAALLKALPGFELDPSRGRFRTWLWQVTCNTAADWMRRRKRQGAAEERWRELREGDPEPDDWAEEHFRRVLEHALEQVRTEAQPRTWDCFERHILQARRSAEVAAELNLTANAVYVNASRVLARLRERCAEYLEELGDG
jgi:RNA polymerase sigma-70 factor (ECF subfamily)